VGDEKPAAAKPSWRGFAFLVAGLLLALGASVLAQRTGLGKSLELDFKGIRAVGTAEPMGDDYNIRYEHPDGTIFRRLYTGRLSGEPLPQGKLEIAIAFDPEEPSRFQPAGLSYLPGVAALTMFIAGMWCVLKGRSAMRRHYLKATGKLDDGNQRKKPPSGKPAPDIARRKTMRIVLAIAIALALLVLFYGCPQLNIPGIQRN